MTSTQENRTQDMWLQEIRESQGNYEQEVMSGDEADLYKYYNSCTKNPDHVQFIDVNSFRSEHLPERYRNEQKLPDFVRALADLTCLIKVSYVSPDRPGTFPFYNYRGRGGFSRSATGWVCDVIVYTEQKKRDNQYYIPCQCPTCQGSGEPRSEWAQVWIRTASHVVFDKSEAEASKCYFFYDNDQQKLTDCPLLTATHLQGVRNYSDYDITYIEYYIHDVLARKLKDMFDRYENVCRDLSEIYGPFSHVVTARAAEEKDDDKNKDDNTNVQLLSDKDKNNEVTGLGVQYHLCYGEDYHQENSDDKKDVDNVSERNDDENNHLLIITSHPHGCSKMVTVGHLTDIHGQGSISYEYSTATCPGSSGAPVYVLGRSASGTCHPHSRHVRGQGLEQVNRSGEHLEDV